MKKTTPAQGLVALGSFEEAARERRSGAATGCNGSTLRFPTLFNFDHFAEIKPLPASRHDAAGIVLCRGFGLVLSGNFAECAILTRKVALQRGILCDHRPTIGNHR